MKPIAEATFAGRLSKHTNGRRIQTADAYKRPTTRPLTAPYKRGCELPGITSAYAVIFRQRLRDRTNGPGRQNLVP